MPNLRKASVRSRIQVDRDFLNAVISLQSLDGQLGLDLESPSEDRNVLNEVPAECPVA